MLAIDFVIYWVDGSDVQWQRKKARYKGTEEQNAGVRFRDWGILKYWFRAVEQYAPWVHRIYFVSDDQIPEWLNIEHPQLTYVSHKDFIPAQYLPTFQANTIENNLHRIQGLSEHFVVFNDDTFINQAISPDYFFRNGLPCDAPFEHVFSPRCYFPHVDGWGINIMEFCGVQVVNAHFNRLSVTRQHVKAWYGSYLGWKYRLQAFLILLFQRREFQHFYTCHNEKAFLKSVYEEVWAKEGELLSKSCTRFREPMSVNNYLFHYWQLASNRFYPVNQIGEKHTVQLEPQSLKGLEKELFDTKVKSLCVNDSSLCSYEEYVQMKPQVINLFERKFPSPSSFEL